MKSMNFARCFWWSLFKTIERFHRNGVAEWGRTSRDQAQSLTIWNVEPYMLDACLGKNSATLTWLWSRWGDGRWGPTASCRLTDYAHWSPKLGCRLLHHGDWSPRMGCRLTECGHWGLLTTCRLTGCGHWGPTVTPTIGCRLTGHGHWNPYQNAQMESGTILA